MSKRNMSQKLLALVTAGVLTMGGAVLAQDDADNTKGQPEQTEGAQVETQAMTEGMRSLQSLEMAFMNLQTEVSELQALMADLTEGQVRLVPIVQIIATTQDQSTDQADGGDAEQADAEQAQAIDVESLISQHEPQIQALQETLQDNDAIRFLLQQDGTQLEDVVAVNVTDDGQVWLYYRGPEGTPTTPETSETPAQDDTDTDDDTQ